MDLSSCWLGLLVNGLLYRTCYSPRDCRDPFCKPQATSWHSTADKMLFSYSLIKRSCRGSMKLFAAPRGTRHLYVQLLREVEGAFRNGVGFVYTGTKAFICKCTFLLLALCLFWFFLWTASNQWFLDFCSTSGKWFGNVTNGHLIGSRSVKIFIC